MQVLRTCLKQSYRFLNAHLVYSVLRLSRLKDRKLNQFSNTFNTPLARKPIWFHAASVGELESLVPLILTSAEEGYPLVLTILSNSAEGALTRLIRDLVAKGAEILFASYSPWEGNWSRALQLYQPQIFITAKYEAWPDLWVSLRENNIPLGIVAARDRRSLRIAKSVSKLFSGGLPELILFPAVESDVPGLEKLFKKSTRWPVSNIVSLLSLIKTRPSTSSQLPADSVSSGATIKVTGDPRWDRVYTRSQMRNPRTTELVARFSSLPRPWGIIGNGWLEDLEIFKPVLDRFLGTLWFVPHEVNEKNVERTKEFLQACGRSPVLSSEKGDEQGSQKSSKTVNTILVNEVGLLAELYAFADWAYVGGGFGVGIHSTIEPSIYGIPVGSGPNGTTKFPEISELIETGQMTVVRNAVELEKWLDEIYDGMKDQDRVRDKVCDKTRWTQEAHSRLGATKKIMASLNDFLRSPK